MKVQDLHKQGWTITETAAETGFHPATISKYLKQGPPQRRTVPDDALVMNAHWRNRITTTLVTYPRLLAISLFHLLCAEGFTGSYPTVVRAVRDVRGPRFRAADGCRCRCTPTPAKRRSSTSASLMTGRRGGGGRRRWCASGRSCAGRGGGCGGSPPPRTATTPSKGWSGSSKRSAGSPPLGAPTGWAPSAPAKAAGSCCIPRRSSSPPTTASRSRRARPATPNARARLSDRSGSCERRSCPNSRWAARRRRSRS